MIGIVLDKYNFKTKTFFEIIDYEVLEDEETNAVSIIKTIKDFEYNIGDFVFINDLNYKGVVADIFKENGVRTIKIKYILNMFDKKVLLQNQGLISSDGLEDFILHTIQDNYINNVDAILNIEYLNIEILTHTKLNFTPSNENGIYNLHTFLNNCTQNYNIKFDFNYDSKTHKLNITIYMQEEETIFIDKDVSDIIDFVETYDLDVISKVTVKTETNINSWYLLNNRTVTNNINDSNRVIGSEDIIFVENEDEAYQEALNIFKVNKYNHLIEFKINENTKLIDMKDIKIRKNVKIKINENILESYISAISRYKNNNFINIKLGNIRINFIDKYNLRRR